MSERDESRNEVLWRSSPDRYSRDYPLPLYAWMIVGRTERLYRTRREALAARVPGERVARVVVREVTR